MKMRIAVVLILLSTGACGKPTTPPGSTNAVTSSNGTTAPNMTNGPTVTTAPDPEACEELRPVFMDAVRELPRACTRDSDCKIVQRAAECDCDLAVATSSETAAYDTVRGQLDTAQCANPFGCAGGQCRYRRLSDPGELVAMCTEGECEMVQVLACSEFTARAHGGIVPPSPCTAATDCAIRTDLNPCGCPEAVSANFPFLTTQAVQEMLGINGDRCFLDCMGCPQQGPAACVPDGDGMICAMQ